MKKNWIIMMLAFTMAGAVFVGCGAQQEEAKTENAAVTEMPEATETPEETETPEPIETLEETEVMYTLADVPLRAEKSKKSKKLDTVPVNTEVQLLEEGEKWCRVNTVAGEGYIARRFLSTDRKEAKKAAQKIKEAKAQEKVEKETAEKAAKEQAEKEAAEKVAQEQAEKEAAEKAAQEQAEQEARAAEQAAAEEAARIAAEQAAMEDQTQEQIVVEPQEEIIIEEAPQEKYEVSRENFDDCDGSGHGYAIIHYSDGSTEQIEY